MKCCGVHRPDEWYKVFTSYLHPACCEEKVGTTTCTIPKYTVGCEEKVKDFISSNVMLVAGSAIGVGVFQVSTWILLNYHCNSYIY